jgi:putative flippase GtrA
MPTAWRFVLVGLLAVAVHYAVLICLVEFAELARLPASIAGFCLAIPVNYYGQHRWVFRSAYGHRLALPRYLAVTLAGLAINAAAFSAGLQAELPYPLAQAAAILAVTAFNFTANRLYTFGDHSSARP